MHCSWIPVRGSTFWQIMQYRICPKGKLWSQVQLIFAKYVAKCGKFLQNVPTHYHKMSKLSPEGKFVYKKNQECVEICRMTEFMQNYAENVKICENVR